MRDGDAGDAADVVAALPDTQILVQHDVVGESSREVVRSEQGGYNSLTDRQNLVSLLPFLYVSDLRKNDVSKTLVIYWETKVATFCPKEIQEDKKLRFFVRNGHIHRVMLSGF